MKRGLFLATAFLVLILLISGCGGDNNPTVIPYSPTDDPGANEIMDTEAIDFWIGSGPSDATVGESCEYSFCDSGTFVVTAKPSDICGSKSLAVTGGNPPYHFQLASGSGFQPMGLILHPNGMLDGTPSTEGIYDFTVCAVDQSGTQDCHAVSLEVKPKEEEEEEPEGDLVCGEGKQMKQPFEDYIHCLNDCQTDDYVDCSGRWGPVPARLTPSICAAEEAVVDNCVLENCCEPEEEPEESNDNGCFCNVNNAPCTTNEDCPDETNAGLIIPGFCACPA